MREIVIRGLGRTNPEAFKLVIKYLIYLDIEFVILEIC
jgi:hypothetical protein